MNNTRAGETLRPGEAPEPFWPGSGPLFVLALIFLFNFLSRIIAGPLMPALRDDLGLNHAQAGALFVWISLGYFISVSCSSLVSSRWNHHRTISLAALSQGAALMLLGLADGVWSFDVGLFVMGLGAGFYLPSGIATLTSLAAPRHWGKAMAVHELAPNLSFVVAPLIVEALLGGMGWRGVFFCLGAAMTILGLAFACRGRGGRFRGQVPSLANIKAILVMPAFWALMLLFSLGIGGSMGVFTMLPLFLVETHGMELSSANFLVSLSRASGLGAAFLAGWLVDRVGFKRTLLMVFAASGLLTMLIGLGQGAWLWLALFLQPALMVCFFPAGFAALAGLGDESARSLAVGLTVPMSFVLGGGGFPAAIGWVAQVYSLPWGFVGAGALILCGVILLPWLDSGAKK